MTTVSDKTKGWQLPIRFGLRSLLLLTMLSAIGLAWWRSQLAVRQAREGARKEALELLATAPNPLGWDYDPIKLARAVNKLHSMGRDEAILTLEAFIKKYPNDGYDCPHQSLKLVIPLLFMRRNPAEKLPSSAKWDGSSGFKLTYDRWYEDFVVEQGLPFHTEVIGGFSG